MRPAFYTQEEILERVEPLVSERMGLIGPSRELPAPSGGPEICAYSVGVSELTNLSDEIIFQADNGTALAGTGASVQRTLAHAKAYCEAIERYCNVVHLGVEHVVASRDELGDEAVNLELFPRCSQAEYAAGRLLLPASNRLPLRWVRGYSLVSGRPQWVPLIAVYLGTGFEYPGENFALPISTGCALAAGIEQATVSAICEAVERDSIMLAWLHRLSLPRIEPTGDDPLLDDLLARLARAGIRQHFFDATTDLGVGTVYAVQVAAGRPLHALVMASTRPDARQCLARVVEEAAGARIALEHARKLPLPFDPADYQSFTRLSDGAVFYGDEANFGAFDFLFQNQPRREISQLPHAGSDDPEVQLDWLVEKFRRRNLELLAVDITAPAVREIGMHAVKVVAPQLLPLSPNYNYRFTATPRLYEAPLRMGYGARTPESLNPWPQPFA
jgi:ribosomal protein S12 methylthiotransferase accessory factor